MSVTPPPVATQEGSRHAPPCRPLSTQQEWPSRSHVTSPLERSVVAFREHERLS
jgi:hypothetical protein